MARVGHVYRARPGRIADYRRTHATVWPELEALLRDAGVTTYVIYAWGDVIFSHMEVDDYDALVARYGSDPVAARWEAAMGDLIELPEADPQSGWPRVLDEVWSLG